MFPTLMSSIQSPASRLRQISKSLEWQEHWDRTILVNVHYLLCARCSSKCLPYIVYMLWGSVLSPSCCKCGHGGSERLNSLPQVTQLDLCSQPLYYLDFSHRQIEQNLLPSFLANTGCNRSSDRLDMPDSKYQKNTIQFGN